MVDGKIIIEPKAEGKIGLKPSSFAKVEQRIAQNSHGRGAGGIATISVTHEKILYSTDISVRVGSEYALLEEPAYINTEASLIKMLNGTTKTINATLSGNFNTGDENGITWRSADPDTIAILNGSGAQGSIQANGHGDHQTYIYIKHPKALAKRKY